MPPQRLEPQDLLRRVDSADLGFASTRELVEAHLRGDPEATRLWLRSVKALAACVTSIINVLDPERILLGGGLFLWRRHAHSRPVEGDGMTEAEHQRLERLKSELLHKDES